MTIQTATPMDGKASDNDGFVTLMTTFAAIAAISIAITMETRIQSIFARCAVAASVNYREQRVIESKCQ